MPPANVGFPKGISYMRSQSWCYKQRMQHGAWNTRIHTLSSYVCCCNPKSDSYTSINSLAPEHIYHLGCPNGIAHWKMATLVVRRTQRTQRQCLAFQNRQFGTNDSCSLVRVWYVCMMFYCSVRLNATP